MIYLVVGFIGAFLMFCGDMLLYYDPNDFNYRAGDSTETKMNAIKEVMGKVSPKRLFAGGFIGPDAAFLFSCLGIIAGGAYHSHCAYLGLLAKDKYKEALNTVMQYGAYQRGARECVGFFLVHGVYDVRRLSGNDRVCGRTFDRDRYRADRSAGVGGFVHAASGRGGRATDKTARQSECDRRDNVLGNAILNVILGRGA